MSLSNMQVFNAQVRTSTSERLGQEVEKFNTASQNTIVLRSKANAGDYAEESLVQRMSGLVRRRNAYGTGSPSKISITELLKTSVKVAAGTPPVEMDPSIWRWIGENPTKAGIIVGEQLAMDSMADMLNTALGACVAATETEATNVHDCSGSTKLTLTALNEAARTMGDRAQDVVCWIAHSTPWFDLIGSAITNAASLFSFGTVAIRSDALGRPIIVTDSTSLYSTGPTKYKTLGLTQSAIVVEDNNDFDQVMVEGTGGENIARTMQAEWTWNLGMKGYTYAKSTGGKSPTTGVLTTGTNWTKIVTSNKDLAGVLVISQ